MPRVSFVTVVLALAGSFHVVAAQGAEAARNAAFIRECLGLMTRSTVEKYMGCWSEEVGNNRRPLSRERLRDTVNDIVNTFPDLKFTILAVVAENDTVVAQVTQSGTHRGVAKTNFNGGGLTGVQPTNKEDGNPRDALVHRQKRQDHRAAGGPRRSHDDASARSCSRPRRTSEAVESPAQTPCSRPGEAGGAI